MTDLNLADPFHRDEQATIYHGDALACLRHMPTASVDSVVSDPPYAEVDRPYGRLSVPEWEALMHATVRECRRVLKPKGSAVFIIQPNSEKIGKLRPWAFDFVSWCCREWNVVRDLYWFNFTAIPAAGCNREYGLARPSLKFIAWLGDADCYRDQDAILWSESQCNAMQRAVERAGDRHMSPSGYSRDRYKMANTALERGGVTPFNLFPFPGCNGSGNGHSAPTPFELCAALVKYITPRGGTVLDPFVGSGTVLTAARANGRRAIGIEQDAECCAAAVERLKNGLTPPGKARGQGRLPMDE